MTRKQKRLFSIGGVMMVLAVAAGLVLTALSDSIAFFMSPTDIAEKAPSPSQRVRLGGLVEEGSVERGASQTVRFRITDTVQSVPVTFTGLLPDLFREGQGVVAEGTLSPDHVFVADSVLAKHDENYMPKEVEDDLKARGLWQHTGEPTASAPATPAPHVGAGA
ncbi:cytochrome c maturation protein CcmE [Consotaella salsifontis]|uniref:Cytochrome c-type biogenesis protein CcmE n=1 Tax=Consotaella salsifontis TaxID=1365950 RepID=A0A1T4MCA8_9HYPH|nr:cytochrome c maturation protein CcmE [Consotaella salsifontis]SJZ64593.1 cytochrome c-type biogenesis protein CcmE [Consotaella salsifontis]